MNFKIIFFSLLMLSSLAYADEVTFNFAFTLTQDKSDLIHVKDTNFFATSQYNKTIYDMESPFVSSENNGLLLALISAGCFSSLHVDTEREDYLFQLTEKGSNKAIIAFTNGTWKDVKNKMPEVKNNGIISRTFGAFMMSLPEKFIFYPMLLYNNIDIISTKTISGYIKLFIKNNGTDEYNRTKIRIGVV